MQHLCFILFVDREKRNINYSTKKVAKTCFNRRILKVSILLTSNGLLANPYMNIRKVKAENSPVLEFRQTKET